MHHLLVVLVEHIESRLSIIMMTDGDLARHDIGQRIDKDGRARIKVVIRPDGILLLTVVANRSAPIEQDHSPVLKFTMRLFFIT